MDKLVDFWLESRSMYHLLNTLNLLAPGFLLLALASPARKEGTLIVTWFGLFASLVASVCAVSAISLVLIELAVFRHRVLQPVTGGLNLLLAGALGIAFLRNRFSVSLERLSLTRWSLAAGALLVAAMAVRVPVSRYIYGGQDQGTYVVMSRMFDRTGRITQHSELLEIVHTDPELKTLRKAYKRFSKKSNLEVEGRYEGAAYPGFYVADRESGTIVPQFFHLHPMWMTILGWLWGDANGVWSLLLFGFLGLCAVWQLARWALADRWAGLLALGFMGFQILQVWTTRYPLSEIPAQGFVLAGLALLVRSLRSEETSAWLLAAVGGVSLGMSFFVRITAAFYGPPLVLFFLASPSARSRGGTRYRAFFYGAFVTMAWAALHNYALSYPYIYDLVRKRLGYRARETVGEVALLTGGALVLAALAKELLVDKLLARPKKRFVAWASRQSVPLATVATLVVAALVGWKLFGSPNIRYRAHRPDRILRAVQLAAFVSWPALVAGLAGIGLMAGRKRTLSSGAPLLGMLGLWFFPVVLLWPPTTRYAYYYCRYYVSDLLPLLLLGVGAFLSCAFRRASRLTAAPATPAPLTGDETTTPSDSAQPSTTRRLTGRALQASIALLGAFVVAFFLYGHFENRTYRRTELTGAWAAADQLAAQVPRHALLVMARRPKRKRSPGFHIMLGTTLQFAYGYETLLAGRIHGLQPELHELGPPVYLFEESPAPRARPIRQGQMTLLVGGGIMPFHHSQKSLRPPKKYYHNWYRYFLYRVVPAHDYEIRPGQRRWKHKLSGFHAWEGRHAWTRQEFQLLDLPVPAKRPVEVTIKLRGIFPKTVDCPIKIEANWRVVHQKIYSGLELKRKKTVGPIRIPASHNQGTISIKAKTCAWRPSRVRHSRDHRPLGLDVNRIHIRALKRRPKNKANRNRRQHKDQNSRSRPRPRPRSRPRSRPASTTP